MYSINCTGSGYLDYVKVVLSYGEMELIKNSQMTDEDYFVGDYAEYALEGEVGQYTSIETFGGFGEASVSVVFKVTQDCTVVVNPEMDYSELL